MAPPNKSNCGKFSESMAKLWAHEGGYVNHPQDKGGETKYGISKAVFKDIDIAALTPVKAQDIYRREYWDRNRCGELPAGLANAYFDACVNHGRARATKLLQQSIGATADGKLGPETIRKAHEVDQRASLEAFRQNRQDFYQSLPTWGTFGRGWTCRNNQVTAESQALATTAATPPASSLGGVDLSWPRALPEGKAVVGAVRGAMNAFLVASDRNGMSTTAGGGCAMIASALSCGLAELAEHRANGVNLDLRYLLCGVSFSLDPAEPTNPEGPLQRKVHYPSRMGGTLLGDVLFEADYLLKKLSLGLVPFPPQLTKLGFGGALDAEASDGKMGWSRLWFVVSELDVRETADSIDIVKVRFGVNARSMIPDATGELHDAPETVDGYSKRFAELCTTYHEELADAFPPIKRLREAFSAILVARFLLAEGEDARYDHGRIHEIAAGASYEDTAPALRKTSTTTTETATCKSTLTRTVFGGVSMRIPELSVKAPVKTDHDVELTGIVLAAKELLSDPIRSTRRDQLMCAGLIPLPPVVGQPIPCSECNDFAVWTCPETGNPYCKYHRLDICEHCFESLASIPYCKVQLKATDGKREKVLHVGCFTCAHCTKPLKNSFATHPRHDLFFHPECAVHANAVADADACRPLHGATPANPAAPQPEKFDADARRPSQGEPPSRPVPSQVPARQARHVDPFQQDQAPVVSCPRCTFIQPPSSSCSMCAWPLKN